MISKLDVEADIPSSVAAKGGLPAEEPANGQAAATTRSEPLYWTSSCVDDHSRSPRKVEAKAAKACMFRPVSEGTAPAFDEDDVEATVLCDRRAAIDNLKRLIIATSTFGSTGESPP